MLNRPGYRTSEFAVALLNFVAQVVMQLNGTVTTGTAVKYSLAGAVAYIISRGLAKYEPRAAVAVLPPTSPTPPTA